MPASKRSYHHGDLRRVLVRAAWVEIRKHGLGGWTLRTLAQKCRVTHAAPYHHFSSKAVLLEELANEGFGELDALITLRIANVAAATDRLYVIGESYIDFGVEHPERLEVMFRRPVAPVSDEQMQQHGGVFEHLISTLRACQAEGTAPKGDVWDLAVDSWTVVHGFTMLATTQLEGIARYRGRTNELRDQVLKRYTTGLRRAVTAPASRR